MTEQIRVSGVRSIRTLVLVALTAGLPRIAGALFLQREPFRDAYCYIEQMSIIRGKIVAGTFSVNDLFGFWLPLYQFFCSIISLVVNQPVYVGKLVSAVAGIGVCVLVYLCSHILTSSQRVSLVAALAIALNPFHLQYSSAAMTDVPHALMVMVSMYFVLTERWTLAACCGAAAGLIRLDSWMLFALVPTIQFMRQRKVPILSTLILSSAPAFWLFVCWKATGNPLASFQAHDQYVLARLTAHPEFSQITFDRMWIDVTRLAYSANIAVLAGCFAALWLLFREWRKKVVRSGESSKVADLLVCLLFFFAYFSFIMLAYLTKNQSDIWHRYGLILFSLGLPVLAYSAQQFFRRPSLLAKAAVAIVLVSGFVQFQTQAVDLKRFQAGEDRFQTIANYLKQEYASDRSIKVFCDHADVRVISGIPREQFYDSWNAPKDREGFLGYLQTKGIKFLVIPKESETSTPSQLFPDLVRETGGVLEDVIPAPDDRRTDSLYRVRAEKPSPPS